MTGRADLIGREREVAELERRLATERLVTITGPGGCGKTTLAMELAQRPLPGLEAVVVGLGSLSDDEQVIPALLRVFGGRERFGRRPHEVLAEVVTGTSLLLVLDDCEHVLASVRGAVFEVLAAAPAARVLATSREPLGVRGESVFRLGPLSVPELGGGIDAVVRYDGPRLFVHRAVSVDPDFALTSSTAEAVIRICRMLDGVPLALCLAAAGVDVASVDEVADGLAGGDRIEAEGRSDDPSVHHRSLRASLDWSHRLLDESERAMLRRLSTFAGGFTVAAARAVAAPERDEREVHDLLLALDSKGLIMPLDSPADERWGLLQTVRDHASENLRGAGEEETMADRHLAFFRAFAADVDARLLALGSRERLDTEAANLRQALGHAAGSDPCAAVSLAASLVRHWILAEQFEEARELCAAALSAAGETDAPAARAVVHCAAGIVDVFVEEYGRALVHTESGLALLAAVDDAGARARCLLLSAMILILTGRDLAEGREHARQALEAARSCTDPLGQAWALVNLSMVEAICDRLPAARDAYSEFLTFPDASAHARLRTSAEDAAAWTELMAGAPERALAHADLALQLEGEAPSMTRFQLAGFRIQALALLGRSDVALREGHQQLTLARQTRSLQSIPAIEMALAVAEFMCGDLRAAEEPARRLLGVPQLHSQALSRELLGRIALASGDVAQAETHGRELQAIAQRTGSDRHRELARFIGGSATVLAGDIDRGRSLLQATLAATAELGVDGVTVDALTALAVLAARTRNPMRAARLAGAAHAARARLARVAPQSTVEQV
ncbi:MAG: hypothetical protein WAU75_16695, partial [Solirubrobacteraceae bacterium]